MGLTGNWDGRVSRRTLLRMGGSASAAYVLLGRSALSANAAPPFASNPFGLGVASGDPTPTGVVLWTRLAPDPLAGGGMSDDAFGVRYEVAADEGFQRIVRRGAVEARPDEAHTVHVELSGLQPETHYWYRFKWGRTTSRVGRTRTAPPPGSTAPTRFAYASCQNYTRGYFGAYADLAAQDVDLVVHLGDYIYEGPGGHERAVRTHVPAAELFTLNDYRLRHAQYRTDPDLQAAHAAHPFLMTWDDHEFKDNYADLDLDPDQPLETVAARRAAAYLAYWEHAPLPRSRKPVGKDMPLFRRLQWGALATFHVLDTRQYRSDQIRAARCATPAQYDPESRYCRDVLDPARAILGAAQRDWLLEGLATPGAAWNVIANQVGFAPLVRRNERNEVVFSLDSWDGYVPDRQRVLDFLAQQQLRNTVVITGDSHENSVRNVPPDFRRLDGDPVATEFLGTSISSEGDDRPALPTNNDNPHRLFTDYHRGYVSVALDPDLWRTEFRVVESVMTRTPVATPLATFVVQNGLPGALRDGV
jgi:alkaline phosphatase D